jgi:hypothetical protein
MTPGSIGFVLHRDNWISRVIAWFMGSKWSHSFLVYDNGRFGDYVVETTDFEVTISPTSKYLTDPNVSYEVYAPSLSGDLYEQEKRIIMGAYPLIGMVYGYAQLFSLGVRRVFMKIGIRIPNFIRTGVVCCHVPLYGYVKSDMEILKDIDPESIDTEELYQIIKNHPRFKLVYSKDFG